LILLDQNTYKTLATTCEIVPVFMASRSNGHAIIFYPVVSIFLFFPHLISAVGDCSLPYFYT